MKKLVLSSVLVGLVYSLLAFVVVALRGGSSAAVNMFAFGAILGVIRPLFEIPMKVFEHKPYSKRSQLLMVLMSQVLMCGTGYLTISSMDRVWPIPSSRFSWDWSLVWVLPGWLSTIVVISVIVKIVKRRAQPANAD